MTAKITRITRFDSGGAALIVPGTSVEEILAAAAGELDDGEQITTAAEDVEIGWWRTTPCNENSCPEMGGHMAHWTSTGNRQTRGGFLAAQVDIEYESAQPPAMSL